MTLWQADEIPLITTLSFRSESPSSSHLVSISKMNVVPRRVAVFLPLRRIPSYTATATTTASTLTDHCRLTTHSQTLHRVSKVPQKPTAPTLQPPKAVQVDLQLVQLLEKLSLVDFANEEGIERLEAAISMANQLSEVDVTGVEPLITVLENISLPLAEDEVTCSNQKEELLACAHTTLEDYYVVPPGNITYNEQRSYHTTLKQQQHQGEKEEKCEE